MTDDDLNEDVEDGGENPNIRQLREKARRAGDHEKAASEAQARVAALERELAFRAAGIDPNDAKAKYFVKGYEGELDADALRAEAEAAGIIAPAKDVAGADEQAAHQRLASASVGGGTETGAQVTVEDELRNAKSGPEIAAILDRHNIGSNSIGPLTQNAAPGGGFLYGTT